MASDPRADAFTAMYRRHYGAVRRYLRRRASGDTVDDLLAEVFTVAWRRFEEIPGDHLPWLLMTAARCLANQRRSVRRRAALVDVLRVQPPPDPAGPYEQVVGADQRAALMVALAGLDPPQRELLLLTEWDGLAPRQAARVLGISRGAVRMRLHRARRALWAIYAGRIEAPARDAVELADIDEEEDESHDPDHAASAAVARSRAGRRRVS